MKLFLSWSGEMSHKVALVLRSWLPCVIQNIQPFISSDDINKGERWGVALAEELEKTQYGIICITPFNINSFIHSSWLYFEAGALSKAVKQSDVSPFLFGLNPPLSQGPLQQFQVTIYDKEDIFHLLSSINNRLDNNEQLSNELLRTEFEAWWPKLQTALDEINDSQETETGFPGLYSGEDLVRSQMATECREIWIITPSLYRRILDPKIKTILQKNLDRGVIYTFIFPDSDDNKENVENVNKEFKGVSSLTKNQINLKNIDEKQFRNLAITDYIILNPIPTGIYSRHAYLELPIKSRGYWIEIDDGDGQAAMDLVSRFQTFAE